MGAGNKNEIVDTITNNTQHGDAEKKWSAKKAHPRQKTEMLSFFCIQDNGKNEKQNKKLNEFPA